MTVQVTVYTTNELGERCEEYNNDQYGARDIVVTFLEEAFAESNVDANVTGGPC